MFNITSAITFAQLLPFLNVTLCFSWYLVLGIFEVILVRSYALVLVFDTRTYCTKRSSVTVIVRF